MKILIVLSIIILVFILLLNTSVIADISYIGGKLDYKISFGLLKLYPFPFKIKKKSGKKPKKANKKDKPEKKKNDKKEKEKPKKSIADTVDTVLSLVEECADGIKKSAGKIRIRNLYISFVIRNDDACTCAVNYGIISGAVYTAVGLINSLFKTSMKKVAVGLEFNRPDSSYDFGFGVKLKFGTALKTVLDILFKYIILILKKSKEK